MVNPKLTDEVKPGDYVQSGFILSNSEVGAGSVQVQPLIYRLVCKNGLIVNEASFSRYHLGNRMGKESLAYELVSEQTRSLELETLLSQVKDTIKAVTDPSKFNLIIQQLQQASNRPLNGKPADIIEVTAQKGALNEPEQQNVLTHLIEGGDLSQWGLVNAITRTSQDVDSYERATELERFGGEVLTMNPKVLVSV